jgi:hypothetical protein
MLDEVEFAEVENLYRNALRLEKKVQEQPDHPMRGRTLAELYRPLLDAYERMTGFTETNPKAIMHHRLALYGPPCVDCGKPLRTPLARRCMACGSEKHTQNS